MTAIKHQKEISYRPVAFILIAYAITWSCAFFMAYQPWLSYSTGAGRAVLTAMSFIESASPLLAALFLLRTYLFRGGNLLRFLFGGRPKPLGYTITALLFAFQFLTFYLFRLPGGGAVNVTVFLSAWAGQTLLGGGMEEGGWRGYLQPALEKRVPAVLSVVLVALVWAFWHLPYFLLPDTFLSGGSFLLYIATATGTAFTLTAIYKMTGSVLLCTLFHGWQNAIVMNIPAEQGNFGFITMFLIQTAVSIVLCAKPTARRG